MKQDNIRITLLLGLILISLAPPARALLKVEDPAPDFTVSAALAGKEFPFHLADALKRGPVVVYFYPKAFTPGCTVEANRFAEASDEFAKYGAQVIGLSNDSIEVLKEFSVKECRNRFAVGADDKGDVIGAYDAKMLPVGNVSKRVSYVVVPDGEKGGRIFSVHQGIKPEEHVSQTLQSVKLWHNSIAIEQKKP